MIVGHLVKALLVTSNTVDNVLDSNMRGVFPQLFSYDIHS